LDARVLGKRAGGVVKVCEAFGRESCEAVLEAGPLIGGVWDAQARLSLTPTNTQDLGSTWRILGSTWSVLGTLGEYWEHLENTWRILGSRQPGTRGRQAMMLPW
jgi:hypothetical protein